MAYRYLTIDIETVAGRPEDAERDMRINWSPSPTWKEDTIGKRYLENLAKKKERLALIDGARIISVALKSDQDAGVLHAMRAEQLTVLQGARVQGYATEREMLVALRYLLDTACDERTTLVGHNIRDFDLPKLRMAFLRNRLRLPNALENEVFDTMREWGHRFSHNRDPFVSVADVCEILGLDNHKGIIDGSQVGELHASGQFDTIVKYNLLDVLAEHDLFQRMTGQSADEAERPKADALKQLPISTAGAA